MDTLLLNGACCPNQVSNETVGRGKAFPRARFRVRLDAGFAAPEIFDFLDEQGDVEYAVAMGKNSILLRRVGKHMARARRLSKASGQTEHVYSETLYATKSWPRKRRVIIKAEVTPSRARPQRQSPLCPDQHDPVPTVGLLEVLLPARRDREPHQGAAPRPRDRSHQLLAVPRQSAACPAHRRCLRPHAGAAPPRRSDLTGSRPGLNASRTPPQDRRSSRRRGQALRDSPPGVVSIPRSMGANRDTSRRTRRLTPAPARSAPEAGPVSQIAARSAWRLAQCYRSTHSGRSRRRARHPLVSSPG